MQHISNWSIARKLTAIMMLTSLITLLLAVSGFFAYEMITFRRTMATELDTLAGITATNSAAAVVFKDPDAARATLRALQAKPNIQLAVIYDQAGNVFSLYEAQRRKFVLPDQASDRPIMFAKDNVNLFEPIISDGERIGTLYLQMSLSEMAERLNRYGLISAGVTLGALLVAFFLASRLQRLISTPILHMAEVAKQVSLQKNYALRATRKYEDEVGQLTDAFNEMLGEIDHRDEDLRTANQKLEDYSDSLETEVMSRTAALQNKTKEAEDARTVAETANRAKSEFLAQMSHELRTPLNGILGYAQILKREKSLSSAQRDGVSIIERSGNHLLNLINEILDLSKIESRKMELVSDNFSLRDLITDITEMIKVRAQNSPIAFRVEETTPLPTGVCGDEKRLRQVLINLLGNAVKFTEKGSVTFRIRQRSEHLHFEIEDTGVGIPAEKLEEIFLPFHQVGDSRKFIEGTGLGLAISQRLVLMMGGTLAVKSTIGVGSVFSFEVSLPEVKGFAGERKAKEKEVVGYRGPRRSVMVVDDRPENRSIIGEMLKPLGFTVIEAESGEACLALAPESKPDFVLMDLMMPGIDGYETTRRLRKVDGKVPILASSASVFIFNQNESIEAGCNDFLSKPVRHEQLIEMLTKYLRPDWIYEEGAVNSSPSPHSAVLAVDPSSSPAAMSARVLPPEAERLALLTLVKRGDIKKLTLQMDQIALADPLYEPLAEEVRQLLREFKIDAVGQLLNPNT
jgi:signal transduction histidine kinase/DNA-binding response OmpR family regulator